VRFIVDAQLPRLLWRGKYVRAVAMRLLYARSDCERQLNPTSSITRFKASSYYHYREKQPVIFWLRIGNSSNQALLRWFLLLWPEIMRRVDLGHRLTEVEIPD
jgi:hypothetical protein